MSATLDERKGLPSGSSALEDSLCPGRWRAQTFAGEQALEFDVDEAVALDTALNQDAEAGRRVHRLYAGQDCPEATEAERQRAERARHVDRDIKQKWLALFEFEADHQERPVLELREFRWWYRDDAGVERYSGQTDAVWIRGHFGAEADLLIGDLKGLWGYHDDATQNQQIRRYIALIAYAIPKMGYTHLRTACGYLNQPAKTNQPAVVKYDEADIAQAQLDFITDLERIMDEAAPRIPGPTQCAKCRAKIICPEYIAAVSDLPVPMPTTMAPLSKEVMTARIEALNAEKLCILLEWAPALANMADITQAEAKKRLRKDPAAVPGWFLKPNPDRSKITQVQRLWIEMEREYKVTFSEFAAICGTTKTALEELIRRKSGARGQALEAKVKEMCQGCTEPIKVSPSLARKT